MLANVIAHWLTSASERSYQGPLAQLLVAEGHKVLFAPVHHPFEHGKDLVAFGPDGALCAYQLKGGDISLSGLEDITGQLLALAATGVNYPGVEPPRRPDRVYLVSNGNLTPPARDRLAAINTGNRDARLPVIELIERENLQSRFLALHDVLLPTSPTDFSAFLTLYQSDGRGLFPVDVHSRMVEALLKEAKLGSSPARAKRAFAGAVMLTAYSLAPWQTVENHLAVGQGWLSLSYALLVATAENGLSDDLCASSLQVAKDGVRGALQALLDECATREDLALPHFAEGLVYPTRALLVLGFLSAYLLSKEHANKVPSIEANVRSVLLREVAHVRAAGECGAGALYLIVLALEYVGEASEAARVAILWTKELARENAPGQAGAIPDPYHGWNEVLAAQFEERPYGGEQFDGQAYSLDVFIGWMARRRLRPVVERLWPSITRVHFAEYRPNNPIGLMRQNDEDGEHLTWAPGRPQRWSLLANEADRLEEKSLPGLLWREAEFLPYLPLVFPHRLTRAVGKALDWMAHGKCGIDFLPEDSPDLRTG